MKTRTEKLNWISPSYKCIIVLNSAKLALINTEINSELPTKTKQDIQEE
jgi:hypothetical protein